MFKYVSKTCLHRVCKGLLGSHGRRLRINKRILCRVSLLLLLLLFFLSTRGRVWGHKFKTSPSSGRIMFIILFFFPPKKFGTGGTITTVRGTKRSLSRGVTDPNNEPGGGRLNGIEFVRTHLPIYGHGPDACHVVFWGRRKNVHLFGINKCARSAYLRPG